MASSVAERSYVQFISPHGGLSVVPEARRKVAARLVEWGLGDWADDVGLAAGELVSNAVLHGSPPVRVRLRERGPGVRLEVADLSTAPPEALPPGSMSTIGRGLAVVAAVSSRWGWAPATPGKIVWCDVGPVADHPEAAPVDDGFDVTGVEVSTGGLLPERVWTVRVPDVPVTICWEHLLHSDEQLRELLLIGRSGGAGLAALNARTRQDALGRRLGGWLRAQVLAAARSGAERMDVVTQLPLSAVEEGITHLAVLDEVDAYCRAERLLALESSPVQRCFRRWLIGELSADLQQAAGLATPPRRSFDTALLDEVEGLTASQILVGRVLEAAPDAMLGVDRGGVIRLANRQIEQLFGYDRHELVGRPVEALVPREQREDHRLRRCAYHAHPVTRPMGAGLDLRGRRKDGSEFPVDVSLSSLQTEYGLLTITAVREIGGSKKIPSMFQSLLEASTDAIVAVDRGGIIRLANRQTEQLFGYPRQDLIGQPVELLVPVSSRGSHPAHRQAYLADPVTRPMGTGLDLRGRRRDGSEFPIDVSLSSLQTDDGLLITAAVRDLTGLSRMRESHKIAEILQRSLLDPVPTRVDDLAVAARYQPAGTIATVGGDWHDVFLLDGGQIGITIGDVGGHGSEAAAVMGRLRTALAAIAPDEPDPGRVLAKVNRMLCRIAARNTDDPTLLTTALYGRLDPTARQFTYAVAGHPGPVIIDAATATARLDDPPPNLPLGLDPGADYTPRQVLLPAQGKLLVCTDGVYERRGTSITDSLTALAANAARLASHHVDDIADALLAAAPPAPPQWSDDLALVIVDWS